MTFLSNYLLFGEFRDQHSCFTSLKKSVLIRDIFYKLSTFWGVSGLALLFYFFKKSALIRDIFVSNYLVFAEFRSFALALFYIAFLNVLFLFLFSVLFLCVCTVFCCIFVFVLAL